VRPDLELSFTVGSGSPIVEVAQEIDRWFTFLTPGEKAASETPGGRSMSCASAGLSPSSAQRAAHAAFDERADALPEFEPVDVATRPRCS